MQDALNSVHCVVKGYTFAVKVIYLLINSFIYLFIIIFFIVVSYLHILHFHPLLIIDDIFPALLRASSESYCQNARQISALICPQL